MRLYIAGPMTGLPDLNYPAFSAAEVRLDVVGYDVLNPARTQGREGCRVWLDYMRASLRDIADADGIATLPGWADSTGASIEVQLGRDLGIPVKTVEEWVKWVTMR